METKRKKIWYAFTGSQPPGDDVCFFEKSDFTWVQDVEANWQLIKTEITAFIQHHEDRLQPYFNRELMSGPEKWKALSFMMWGKKFRKNSRECPETMKIMKKIPGLVSVSISLLEPDMSILPHRGVTNAVMRGHLGLAIPAPLPACGISVEGEERGWEEGRVLLFNDYKEHQAWNRSDSRRIVLLFDVILPEFMYKKRRICSIFLTHLLAEMSAKRLPIVRKTAYQVLRLFRS